MARLNPRELDVLNILWGTDREMTSTDIVNEMAGLTQSTVIAVLRKLTKEGYVKVAGVTHSGKVLSRTYRPAEDSREYITQHFTEDYASFSNVISQSDMCAAILRMSNDSEKAKSEISKLKNILAEYEKTL